MNKLGSEFLRVFDNYERPILFGRTKRQLVFMVGLLLSLGLTFLFWYLGYPDLLTYLAMCLILPPFTLYGLGKDKEFRERLLFKFTIQERAYMVSTRNERKLTKHDFIQKKGTKEADQG